MTYSIRRTNFFIEITPDKEERQDERIKERIHKRKASTTLFCYECKNPIKRNELYIRDKFWYTNWNRYAQIETTRTKVNNICLNCWKGEIPINTSANWREPPLSSEKE